MTETREAVTVAYLVRHAHAHWRPSEHRGLSEAGRAAAVRLAHALSGEPITAIYSSPARRAIQTIEPLAEASGLRPEIVADLRERELVVPEGVTFESAAASAWLDPGVEVGGSESNRAAATRGSRVLRGLLTAHRGQSVVLSTHGNLLALTLNAFDACYDYETWRSLSFPDVYRLTFQGEALLEVVRAWGEPSTGAPRSKE